LISPGRITTVFDEGKIQTLLLAVFGLVVIVVGIALAAGARKAQYSETARVGFNTFVAIVIVAIGMGAIGFAAFGKKVLDALGIG
jgi:hypothetical protein